MKVFLGLSWMLLPALVGGALLLDFVGVNLSVAFLCAWATISSFISDSVIADRTSRLFRAADVVDNNLSGLDFRISRLESDRD